jgi:hypothetical protein
MRTDRSPTPASDVAVPPVELNEANRVRLAAASASCDGDAAWRRRKQFEAADLLRLTEVAPKERIRIGWMDLREALRVLICLGVPVPCRPRPDGELAVIHGAVLGLTYPPEAVRSSLPGSAFLQILEPHGVWHANVGGPGQSLCLGARLPAGIRTRELVIMAYGALSMQSVQIDEYSPAGVMNHEAATWWQHNRARIPLTRTPILGT